MFGYFTSYSFLFIAFVKEVRTDAFNSSDNSILSENNISKEDLLELMLNPELTPFITEEFKGKHFIQKSRKQINTTIKNELQYVKKKFIYRGNFLTFCSILFGIHLILIFSIQVWILISRIEIKNGKWSFSSAEKTTWWFDQVENLGDELELSRTQKESEELIKKRDFSQDVYFSHTSQDKKKLKER
ncbi:hypothetical protein ACH3XW_28315 [Acanthocheilonema viteae]